MIISDDKKGRGGTNNPPQITVCQTCLTPHPGGILAEELKHLGVSADDFAREIGVSSDLITTILAEKESITPEIAQKISQVLKVPGASTWVAMQADYDGWQSKKR